MTDSESEIFICLRCGQEHEATTQEVASYLCPKLPETNKKPKVLDTDRIKSLTKNISLSESQEP